MFWIEFSSLSSDSLKTLAGEKLASRTESWETLIWQFIQNFLASESSTIQVSTSGSTGAPKTITHSRQAMLYSAKLTSNALGLTQSNNCLLCLPANKIGGMMMIVRCLLNKMDLCCVKPSTTPLNDLPEDIRIDFAAFTPMQFHQIVESYQTFKKAETIQKVILGGEDVRGRLLQQIRLMNTDVYATFGMTETISHIALKKLNGSLPDEHFKVLPGINISTNANKQLIVESPELGVPQLLTNDLVELISDKEFDWLGRIDNVINSGGVKIYPEEIEQSLMAEIEPAFFIASVPDEKSGNKLVLAIELPALNAKDMLEMKEVLLRLDKLHRPKEVLLINNFVRTQNGKVRRTESLNNITQRLTFDT